MTRSPRLRSAVTAVAAPALAVVLALTLSSCQPPEAGAAATVGDRRISVASVQEAYQDIVPLVGQDSQVTQTQILNLLILEPYLITAAAAQGHGVSANDARLDIKAAGTKVDVATLSNAAIEVWQANLAFAALQTDRTREQVLATFGGIGKRLKADGVHINPRYGARLDYSTFNILPEKPNWLVTKAAATPGATPTP